MNFLTVKAKVTENNFSASVTRLTFYNKCSSNIQHLIKNEKEKKHKKYKNSSLESLIQSPSLEKYTNRLDESNLDHLNLIIIKPLTFVICN